MTDDRNVLALFVDMRGFTRWSEANEVFINLEQFISGFTRILHRRFSDFHIRSLGDGALLVLELPTEQNQRDAVTMLSRTLVMINKVEADFRRHCGDFARRVGHTADLRLGWGVVRGKVMKVGDDWAGHNLNKCSRLCGEARPFGIAIDRDDFPELPRDAHGLVSQVRRLQGIGEVNVWVSAEIASQFVPRERLRETPEVHVAGTCFTDVEPGRLKFLFARRAADRRLFPGKFEGCGGQLRYSETFTEGVQRHFWREFGIDVEVFEDIHNFYVIREANEPVIPGIRFLCRRVGSIEPSSVNHSEMIWVDEPTFHNMPEPEFVGNLKHETIELVERFRRSHQ